MLECSFGCGAYLLESTYLFQVSWPEPWFTVSIAAKELVPIVIAAVLWGHGWSGKHVCFHCDNEAVVLMIQVHNAHKELLYTEGTQCSRGCHFSRQLDFIVFSRLTSTASPDHFTSDSIPVISTELGVTSLNSTVCTVAANGLSANTSKSYRSGLNRYLSFCSSYPLQACPCQNLLSAIL